MKAARVRYVYLKDLIVTLALHPGTILTEVQVAAATGVSRTPVREAFFRLSSERLLNILPRRGAVVPEITVRGIREQAETRYVLEGHGVEWICENEIEIADDLKSLIAQQRHVLDTEPDAVVEMVSIDKEFHWELVRATGNTEFAQLYNTSTTGEIRTRHRHVRGDPRAPRIGARSAHRHRRGAGGSRCRQGSRAAEAASALEPHPGG